MPAGAFLKKNVIAIGLILTYLSISNATEPNNASTKLFQYLTPDYESSDTRAVADALGFQNWPKSDVWRVAPDVNKSMLNHPEKITKENKGYYTTQFGQNDWGHLDWRLDRIVENDKPLPTDLPEEMKKNLFRSVAPELQNDPNFTKKYYEETLNKYRQRCSNRFAGSLRIEICNTPSTRAAQEYFLSQISGTPVPSYGVISRYSSADKLSDLGTMSYVNRANTSTLVEFIKDNIFVTIRGENELSDEALHLARKIDSAIVKSPAFTYEQLISRRPVLSISSAIKKEKIDDLKSVSYDIRTPNEVNVVDVKAMVGESRRKIDDGKIIFGREIWPINIKLTAITSELLVGQCEKIIEIPDENKEPNQTEPNGTMGKLFEVLTVPPKFETADNRNIAESLGFQNWPQTKVWRVAPDIGKSMLNHPEQVTNEHKDYYVIQFSQGYWGCCHWSANKVIENDKSSSTEMPEERKKDLLRGVSPELRNDPNFVKRYSDEMSKRYRETHKYHPTGSLSVKIYNTPNSTAANELLLSQLNNTQMMASGVISMYSHADKVTDLGTLNYVLKDRDGHPSSVKFIRDNIVVIIRCAGEYSDDVLQFAKKIDSSIITSPALNYEQLISRRPVLTISGDIKKNQITKQKSVSYNFSAPNDVNIVDAKTEIRGQNYGPAKGNNIILPRESGPADIKLTAITNELLVGQCEKTIEITDVNTVADF